MGGLCEERSEKGRGGRNMERKGHQQGPGLEIKFLSSGPSDHQSWKFGGPDVANRQY